MAGKAIVEPMNVTSSHPKLRVTLRFADSQFIAGDVVSGKMEMECKAEKGLAVSVIQVELFGVEELTSRDHSATQTFLHTERIFQGPGLPPSNSVYPHPPPGQAILPHHYYYARRGTTTFLFRLPLPASSPSSIDFGSGLAQVRYEVRATVQVIWKGQKQIVTDKKKVGVVESYDRGPERVRSEGIVVGENGKIWVQGKLLGGVIIPGQPACVELTVKNHSAKKNSSLAVSLTRELILPKFSQTQKAPLQISDTLASVTFRGPEYTIQPGVEGIAHLVFDVPETARSVRGRKRHTAEGDTNGGVSALFEVQASVAVRLVMGIGSKDVQLDLPARICHPNTIPEDVFMEAEALLPDAYSTPDIMNEGYSPPFSPMPYLPSISPAPYLSPVSPPFIVSPAQPPVSPLPFVDQGQVWIPPIIGGPLYNPYSTPPPQVQQYPYPPLSPANYQAYPPRPSSAQPIPSSPFYLGPSGLPSPPAPQPVVPLTWMTTHQTSERTPEREEGKGDRAARISHHLRISSRHRSVSPQSHRYALPSVDAAGLSGGYLNVSPHSRQDYAVPQEYQGSPSPQHTPLQGSPSLSAVSGDVASPRPGFSPRHSFAADPITHATLTKSNCVEALEYIAAETIKTNEDMSKSVPDLSPNLDKTLPMPPVPSSRTKSSSTDMRPRVDMIFNQPLDSGFDETPPTPTLAAVNSPKALRSARGLSGLDALEARLLAEVGTRKMDENKRPDVRSVLPIAIPRPADIVDLAVDSAISSLSLPSLGANEGTLKLSTGSRSNSPESHRGRNLSGGLDRSVQDKHVEQRNKDGRFKTQKTVDPKEREHHRLKKQAQGRVAAWLGSIDPEAPPQSATPPFSTPSSNNVSLPAAASQDSIDVDSPDKQLVEVSTESPVRTQPNPRSSGFMPLGTIRSIRGISPAGAVDGPPAVKEDRVSPRRKLPAGLVFPPRPVDSEVRYDVRSARGGRGGKVTAIAAIWGSAAQPANPPSAAPSDRATPRPFNFKDVKTSAANGRITPKEKPVVKPLKSTPVVSAKPPEATIDRAKRTKASSVPAVLSSSLAIPMLSSTASLARPVRNGVRTKSDKSSSAIPETSLDTANIASPKTELAFGQARLRELIKKYQG